MFCCGFVLIIIGVNSIQQEPSRIEPKKTPEIEFLEPSEDLEIIPPKDITPSKVPPVKQGCLGDARCISGFVTRIVDGDTRKLMGNQFNSL